MAVSNQRPGEAVAGQEVGAPLHPAEAPLLLALALAPLVAGSQALVPAMGITCLVWLALLLRLALPGHPPLRAPRAWPVVLALPLVAALSLLPSVNRGASLAQVLLFAGQVGALWLVADITARGGGSRVVAALLAGALVVAGLGVREYLETVRSGNPEWRVFGTFTNPNFFAGYLAPAILLSLGLAPRRPEAFKPGTWLLTLGLLAAALAGALALTASRGGALAIAAGLVGLLVFAVRGRSVRGRDAWLNLGTIGAVLLLTLGVLSGNLLGRDKEMVGAKILPPELCPHSAASAATSSNRFRVLTWQATARMALRRPVLGWGAGSYESAFAPHAIAAFTRHAHNGYLQVAAEMGGAGLLALLALLTAAVVGLWRSARDGARPWLPGVAGALAALGAHNLFESLLYVPASGFLTWSLAGLALAPPQAPEPDPRRSRALSRPQRPWVILPALALLATLLQLAGRQALEAGRASHREAPAAALDSLRTAQALLPWEPQVYRWQARANAALGRFDEAVTAAQKMIALGPEHPPAYYNLATLYAARGDSEAATATLRRGLDKAPNEIQLLYPLAQMLDQADRRPEALGIYRKIVQVEESPVGQTRALSEVLDHRFARARMELARTSEGAGDREAAFLQRRAAACFLAVRRELHDINPGVYNHVGGRDAQTEHELRSEERQLWDTLAEEYRRRGENRLAELSEEQASHVEQSWSKLDEILSSAPRLPD